jgi:hypothetical protein
MTPMLRTFVLMATHLSMLACGVGLTLITLHSRRQALKAREAALDTHELFLAHTAARQRPPAPPVPAPPPSLRGSSEIERTFLDLRRFDRPGRHRAPDVAPPPPPSAQQPSLLPNRSLDETVAILATRKAQRVQDHRAFVAFLEHVKRTANVRTVRQPRIHTLVR